MSATERRSSERAFHDRQAGQRAAVLRTRPGQLRFTDDAYLDHETWIRPAFGLLGDVRGLDVLDYGCGHGMAAVVLARRGARVTALDLSFGYIQEARARAAANAVTAAFAQADAERLPFAAGSFDRVWGSAILHHLDIAVAARELRRVLRPGGVGVFCEPWGENPLLHWVRRCLPYHAKARTPDEEPLRRRQLNALRTVFPRVEMRGFQLLSMARRVLRPGRVVAGLDWCDDMLLTRVPVLQRWCRYVVLRVQA
jgi:2-polyprenyl-3-methyl-5-hydroxy-6-metoxy-1,4-benzoquinol methylase